MTRSKLVGLSICAVGALFATTAADAAATEEKTKMLPESGITFISKSGEGSLTLLNTTLTMICKKDKGSGTIESANLGKYETSFEECRTSGATNNCKGATDTAGIILNKGTYHFWLALETVNEVKETLVGALVFLPEEIHFTCVIAGLNNLFLVKGCFAALATPLNTLTKVTKDAFALAGGVGGDQLVTEVLPQEATKEIECVLLIAINSGAFTMSALNGIVENEKFLNVKKEEVTVLLMNPEAKE